MHLMNFIGLIQYLTPAILTGSLDCQHAQIFYIYYSCASRGATAKSLIAFRCDYYTSNEPY